MARSDKLYDKSPKLARGEDDKVTVKKGGDKKDSKGSGEPDDSPLPADPVKDMHARHLEEMKDMHKRHQKEVESKGNASAGEGEGDKKPEKDKKE